MHIKGRSAKSNPDGRFESATKEALDDGWYFEPIDRLPTQLTREICRTAITYNNSPDIPFDRSINPYRGCEHGCIYCYARPTHGWINLSSGLDFESKLFYKENLAEALRRDLSSKNYKCQPIALGVNTDAYQPIERKLRITRLILQILLEANHPVTIVTKSSLIERDIDLLREFAKRTLISVAISITTLDVRLMRNMEPRASLPQRRLQIVTKLAQSGIPVSVMIAPVIPILTDHELEKIMSAAKDAGASTVDYVMLRLPHDVSDLFEQWLDMTYQNKSTRVMNIVRDMRGGKNNDSTFGSRMRGTGVFAEIINKRFAQQYKKLGFKKQQSLRVDLFDRALLSSQLSLF